jgi:hypothetical protein
LPNRSSSRRSGRGAHARARRPSWARWLAATAAVVVLAAGVVVGTVVTSSDGASTSYEPPSQAHPVLAAFYFGQASPINFWNSDLSGAPAAFAQMKQEGFNAVELAVPWGEFQPGISPVSYNAGAFTRLVSLVSLANRLHLQAVLRLSYSVDVYPKEQAPNRFMTVFGNQTAYNAWLAYITKVRQSVARFPNVKIGELSWEDFWQPVAVAQTTTTLPNRLQLATETGYRSWLQRTYSLTKVSQLYGATFTSWSKVPTPLNTQPAFRLVYQYDDWAVVNRFFVPASSRFPGLNLEARVESDALYNGSTQIGLYSHASTFKLPGTSYIGMYFEPYMNDPSTTKVETVPQALAALQTTLSSTHARSGGLPLYIFEFEIVSNSPVISSASGLPSTQVPQFVLGSAPLLHKYTIGYSLWTYRDYNQSPLYNPSFSLGTTGWTTSGSATPSSSSTGSSLSLAANASVGQKFNVGDLAGPAGNTVTVSFTASAPAGSSATVRVNVAGAATQSVTVQGGPQTYQLQFPGSAFPNGTPSGQLSIATTAPATISDVQLYNFTQFGDVYSTTGAPEAAAAPLVTLNRQLAGG